jgi:phage tail sheath protein FI
MLRDSESDTLGRSGVNCLRAFAQGEVRVWGARTTSSDPEWKYVNLRRYFAYLEHSIDRGTQWTVFEPNGEPLWESVSGTILDFLFEEFRSGALAGAKPEEAFFVKCDRTTMTQNDLDDGRLVCVVGVAPVRPAEFVNIRIGRWTADHS